MNKKLLIIISLTLFYANPSMALTSYQGCVNIKYNIYYYDKLRRQGGKVSEMNRWQIRRNEMTERYNDNRCRKRFGLKPEREAKKQHRKR